MRTNRTQWTTLTTILALGAAGCVPALAETPRKQPLGRYAELWTKSPFTVPPVEETVAAVEVNPLEDYTLAGVCEMKGGWFVVLINKKMREERIRIKPNEKNEQGFEVVKVSNGANYKESKVEISHGGKKGWVEYDDKFLVLKQAAASVPRGPRGQPGQPQQANARPRVPPTPGAPGAGRGRTPNPTRNGSANGGQAGRVPTPPATAGSNGNTPKAQPTGGRTSGDRGGRTDRGGRSRGRGR